MLKIRLIAAGISVIAILAGAWYVRSLIIHNASQAVKIDNLEASVKAMAEAAKTKEKNNAKSKAIPADRLDPYIISRGWMRSDSDR